MSVTVAVPSAKKASRNRKKVTSRKLRENQNVKINELASLIPLSSSPVPSQGSSNSLVPAAGGGSKPRTISVLRLTSGFFKLHNFMKGTSSVNSGSSEYVSDNTFLGQMEEAIDGFLIILDREANILYVSETIAGYVGLLQQDVIGQNLTDITYPEFYSEILDSLKPPSTLISSSVDDCVILSQYRQFRVKFKPNVSYSTLPSHCTVQIRGNLKVKLTSVKSDVNDETECAKPSVVGFVGECRIVESICSILEISVPSSSFTLIRSIDFKKIISIESSVKYVLGYDPEMLLRDHVKIVDFLHPADQQRLLSKRDQILQTGHGLTPCSRLLTSSGDWVWIRSEATRHCKIGTSIPQFWEIKVILLSRCGDEFDAFKQRKLYTTPELNEEQYVHEIVPSLNRMSKYLRTEEGAKPSPEYICKTTMSPESPCQRRPVARSSFSQPFKQRLADHTTKEMSSVQDAKGMLQGNNCSSMSVSELSPHAGCSEQLLSTSGCLSSSTPSGSPSNSTFSQTSPGSQSLSSDDSPSTFPLGPSHPPVCCDDNMFKLLPYSLYGKRLQQQDSSFIPATTASQENVVQRSTLAGYSIGRSSPVGCTNTMCTTQEDFHPNQFLASWNNSSLFSSPTEMYSTSNCSNSTLTRASANLVEMDTLLNSTTVNTNSIPSQSSVSFPNSHSPVFVPQLPQNFFNVQIPPSFNFADSSNFTLIPSKHQSSEFYPNQTINPEYDAVQQILKDMTGDSTNCDSIPDASLSTDLSFPSHSCPQSDFNVQNAHLASMANTHTQTQSDSVPNELVSQSSNNVDSQSSLHSCSTLTTLMGLNPEVGKYFQQFT